MKSEQDEAERSHPSFSRPDAFLALDSDIRDAHAKSNDDLCRILVPGAPGRYFVRGCLSVSVRGESTPIRWGLWAEVSQADFLRALKVGSHPGRVDAAPFEGRLANAVPSYADSVGLALDLRLTGPGSPPELLFEPGIDHPFPRKCEEGVDAARASAWSDSMLSAAREEGDFDLIVDVEQGVNRFTLRGTFGLDALTRALLAVGEDPDYRPGRDFLIDMSTATVEPLDGPALLELAQFVRGRWTAHLGTRVAVVAPRSLDFERARIFQLLQDKLPFHYGVFRSLSKARVWLEALPLPLRVASGVVSGLLFLASLGLCVGVATAGWSRLWILPSIVLAAGASGLLWVAILGRPVVAGSFLGSIFSGLGWQR